MDGVSALHVEFGHAVDGLADNVEHTAFDLVAGRHEDGVSGGHRFQSALQSVGIVHGDASHSVLTDMLLHFHHKVTAVRSHYFECVVNFWEHLLGIETFCIEEHVDDRSDNL